MSVIGEGSGNVKLGQRKVADINTPRQQPQYGGKTVNVSGNARRKR